MIRFVRTTLRTIDVPGARAFYAPVLGTPDLDVFPLHENAVARGAMPHFLGQLGVPDVRAADAAFIARGAERLGPPMDEMSVLRDPGGALVGLTRSAPV